MDQQVELTQGIILATVLEEVYLGATEQLASISSLKRTIQHTY